MAVLQTQTSILQELLCSTKRDLSPWEHQWKENESRHALGSFLPSPSFGIGWLSLFWWKNLNVLELHIFPLFFTRSFSQSTIIRRLHNETKENKAEFFPKYIKFLQLQFSSWSTVQFPRYQHINSQNIITKIIKWINWNFTSCKNFATSELSPPRGRLNRSLTEVKVSLMNYSNLMQLNVNGLVHPI